MNYRARLMGLGVVASLFVWSGTAIAQAPAPNPTATARVEAYIRATYPGAPRAHITIDYVDLNSDGTPEAVVIIDDMNECGTRGCGIVLDLSADKAESIGTFMTRKITALPTSTKGWRDIAVSGNKVRFKKDSYG